MNLLKVVEQKQLNKYPHRRSYDAELHSKTWIGNISILYCVDNDSTLGSLIGGWGME